MKKNLNSCVFLVVCLLCVACAGSPTNAPTPTAAKSSSQATTENSPAYSSTPTSRAIATSASPLASSNKSGGVAGNWNLAAMMIGHFSAMYEGKKPDKSLTYFAAKLSQDPSWFPPLQKDGEWVQFFEDGSLNLKFRMPLQAGSANLQTSLFSGKYFALSDHIKVEMFLQSGERDSLPKKGAPTSCDVYPLDDKNFMWMLCPNFGGGIVLLSRSGVNTDAIDTYLLKQSGALIGASWKPVGMGESCSLKELNQAQRAMLKTQYQNMQSSESGRSELRARGERFYDAAHATVFFDDGSFFMGGLGGVSANGRYEIGANTINLTFEPTANKDFFPSGQYPYEIENNQLALVLKIQGRCILYLYERS